jgi:dTDP-4-dehydrorhamnose reductase
VLAMQAIREVVPHAQLILNEDIGTTYSTPALAYQAEFENERRWLTFDLLCGHVGNGHPMARYLCWLGVSASELRFFENNPCVPDILGLDYYVTSERFLDDRTEQYPAFVLGGNVRERYADVEAVRVRAEGINGLMPLLREAWRRYGLPIAVTEAHIGASENERVRWFWEIWQAARQARDEGIDVRAVTAWALLGCCDWDSLVTRIDGHYEPGVFEMRGALPHPTALSDMLQTLAEQGTYASPILDTPGWWRRPERILYPESRPLLRV